MNTCQLEPVLEPISQIASLLSSNEQLIRMTSSLAVPRGGADLQECVTDLPPATIVSRAQ